MSEPGTLHFFCGKMAAGKSTKAAELASNPRTILISEDDWLGQLYPVEIQVFDDFIKYSARLKPILVPHVQSLLASGLDVVLDFPGNTIAQRTWFREIFADRFSHTLHYIEASDELCLQQLKRRSASKPEGAAFTTDEEFHHVTSYFQPPSASEGFNIELYQRNDA